VTTPLEGIRVLDLSNFLAGPVAVKILQQLGASVIKFEPPGGDPSRRGSGQTPDAEHNPPALTMHRNKRSISVDLKQPDGLEILKGLVRASDVMVENYRPGIAERLGVGYEALSKVNPRLVYCSISGYGATGPMSRIGTTDGPVQAYGGVASLFRGADETSPGQVSPVLLADVPGGFYAALAIMSALIGRERTGRGGDIDIGLYESMLQTIPYQVQEALSGGPAIPRRSSGVQMPMLQGSDGGWLYVQLPFIPIADRFNQLITEMTGIREPADDPRFATPESRAANGDEYIALVKRAFAQRTQIEWAQALWDAGIPAAPANTVEATLRSEQLAARGGLTRVRNGKRETEVLANPFHFVAGFEASAERSPTPWIGQHNVEILREVLGYDDERIAQLERAGVIWSAAASAAATRP
jgi:crotonobetainyl-CoA:carnitine CoA-transferase CaiB-like acyl-CoA transferase